jgi:hypothetical protein
MRYHVRYTIDGQQYLGANVDTIHSALYQAFDMYHYRNRMEVNILDTVTNAVLPVESVIDVAKRALSMKEWNITVGEEEAKNASPSVEG